MGPVDERLAELARATNLAPEELLAQALLRAREKDIDLAASLIEMGLASPERVKHLLGLARASVQTCALHPERAASGTCSLCGKPVCMQCSVKGTGGLICSRCLSALPPPTPKKRWPAIAGASAAAVLVLFFAWYVIGYMAASGHYEKGLAALAADELERAEQELKACLARREDFRDCRFQLGLVLRRRDRAVESVRELSRYLQLHPGEASAHVELARSRELADDGAGCRKAYAKASELAPRDASLARERAMFLSKAHPEEEEAVRAVQASLKLDSEDRKMLWVLGELLERRGEKERAYDALSWALSPAIKVKSAERKRREKAFVADKSKAARLKLHAGRLASSLGRKEKALKHVKEAHHILPADVDVVCFYAKLLLDAGEARRARTVVGRLTAAGSTDAKYLRTMRDLARAADERATLKRALRKLISVDPSDEESVIEYLRLCLAEGDMDEADAVFAALRGTSSLRMQLLRLRRGYAKGEAGKTLASAKELLERHPDSSEAVAMVVLGLRMEGEPLRAYGLAKEKLEAGMDSPEIFLEGGVAIWAAGFPELANECFERGGEAGTVFLRRMRALGWVKARSEFESELLARMEKLPPQRYADAVVALARAKCALYVLAYLPTAGRIDLERNISEARHWVHHYPGVGTDRSQFLAAEARRLARAEADAARILGAAFSYQSRVADPEDAEDPFASACDAFKAQADSVTRRLSSARGSLRTSKSSGREARVGMALECLDGRLRAQEALSSTFAQRAAARAQHLVELLALEVCSGPTGFAYAPLARRSVRTMWEGDARAKDILAQMGNAELACVRLLLLIRTKQAEGAAFVGVEK